MLQVACYTFNFIQENTYVVYDDESLEAVIIDAGNQYDNENQRLFTFITDQHLQVTRLLNTHAHIDHIIGNEACATKFGLQPEIHAEDLSTFENTIQSSVLWGVDLSAAPLPKLTLREHEEIVLGNERLKILFTPGHSSGHVSFYSAKQHFILSGDVIFHGSIGRTDLPGGDTKTLHTSIQKKIYMLPPQTAIYSGHGEPTTVGFEMANNPFVRGA
ncbi:MAG: MBL fold metallo-hydrolase [Bacteroidetes bacterium]|nr:MBL fold metallo-hydrolase [Bacteroidota bacterium]